MDQGENIAVNKVPRETDGCGAQVACGRQNAKALLRDRISMLQHEVEALKALHDTIPERMDQMAELALWRLLSNQRNI